MDLATVALRSGCMSDDHSPTAAVTIRMVAGLSRALACAGVAQDDACVRAWLGTA